MLLNDVFFNILRFTIMRRYSFFFVHRIFYNRNNCSFFFIQIVRMSKVENSDNKVTEYFTEFLNETFQSDRKVLYSTWYMKNQ